MDMEQLSITEILCSNICEAVKAALACINHRANHDKIVLRKSIRSRDFYQGDISIPAGCIRVEDTQQQQILTAIEEYYAKKDSLIESVVSNKHSFLAFYIHRPKFCGKVIRQVLERGSKYGCSGSKKDKTICVLALKLFNASELTNMRTDITKYHAIRLLEANGYTVHDSPAGDNHYGQLFCAEDTFEDHSKSGMSETEQSDVMLREFCSTIQDRISISSNQSPITVPSQIDTNFQDKGLIFAQNNNDNVAIDLKQFISKKGLLQGKGGFDINLKSVQVIQDGKPSQILRDTASVASELASFLCSAEIHCLHVVAQNSTFANQQAVLLLRWLADSNLTQSQLVVGPVRVQDASQATAISAMDFYRTRLEQFQEASDMRSVLGNEVCDKKDLHNLAIASIIIDALSNTCSSSLCLDYSVSDRGAESRMGAFILYNTARLLTLLNKFEQSVATGLYPPLPPLDEIDWMLLREKEDWELVYHFLSEFPETVSQSVELVCPGDNSILSRIHTHKVTNFLVMFCKCLSAHYSRYHILTGRESHLLPLLHARIYLMKAALQVLLNCLYLIGVKPLSYL